MAKKKQKSEFGRGFVYNLILFAKHWYQAKEYMEQYEDLYKGRKSKQEARNRGIQIFFNGASDHLFEFQIPKQFRGKKIGKLAKKFQDFCLEFGHGSKMLEATEKDFEKAFEMLEELARLIDKELGVKDIEAEWN